MAVDVDTLTPDSQVIALLCTTLALPRGTKPLAPTEWASLATAIHRSELQRPGELLGCSVEQLQRELHLPGPAADVVQTLLSRGGQLAFELERLQSRGIWLVTRADADYPQRLKERLKNSSPPVLFGSGRREHLARRGVAVVGSRNADEVSLDFAAAVGRRLAQDDTAVISGAARGIDSMVMAAAAESGGVAIGVVADALEKAIRRQDLRAHIAEGAVTLLSPYHPEACFTVGNAMRRNRLIYCFSEVAIVVATGDTGGTREGALENLKAGWVPVFVRNSSAAPPANLDLIRVGAGPLSREDVDEAGLLERLIARRPSEQLAVSLEADTAQASSASAPAMEVGPETGPTADAQEVGRDGLAEVEDAFVLVWPALEVFLQLPRTEREVADRFGLELTQARAWLKRGYEEDQLQRLDRPRRYQVLDGSAQLFGKKGSR